MEKSGLVTVDKTLTLKVFGFISSIPNFALSTTGRYKIRINQSDISGEQGKLGILYTLPKKPTATWWKKWFETKPKTFCIGCLEYNPGDSWKMEMYGELYQLISSELCLKLSEKFQVKIRAVLVSIDADEEYIDSIPC
ncbi:MAG: hypothetical protein WC795_00050 [Candidatus Paceibacterota bacterium]|jgi:hypothetical protein